MSLRQEIETWVSALAHYDNKEYDGALLAFKDIADTSKILFNCGVIYATLGEHGQAVECYQRAVQLDQYLAVAYFQQGVSNFLLGDFEEALANFNDTLLYLRGNRNIDYTQLGLKFRLHSCEALFNRGLCYFYLQQTEEANSDLVFASQEAAVPDHSVINEAIRDTPQGYTVFSIPVGLVFRPNEAKVKNMQARDYLGRARLIAQQQQEQQQQSQARTGSDGRRQLSLLDLSLDDRGEDMSFAAAHLVKPGLTSRARQQSEPPMSRSAFPPTPPPEPDQPSWMDVSPRQARPVHVQMGSRSNDVVSPISPDRSDMADRLPKREQSRDPPGERDRSQSRQRPGRLELGIAAFDHATLQRMNPIRPPRSSSQSSRATSGQTQSQDGREQQQRPRLRIGTQRSSSEKPPQTQRRHRVDSAVDVSSSDLERGGVWTSHSAVDPPTRHPLSGGPSPAKHKLPPHTESEAENIYTLSPQSWASTPPLRRARSNSDAGRSNTASPRKDRGRQRPASIEEDAEEEQIGDETGEERTSRASNSAEDSSGGASSTSTGGGGLRFEIVASSNRAPASAPSLRERRAASRSRSRPAAPPHRRGGDATSSDDDEGAAATVTAAAAGTREGRGAEGAEDALPPPSPPALAHIKLKLHAGDETRSVVIPAAARFADVLGTITAKLGWAAVKVRIKDEDGDPVVLGDEEDWDMAVDACRAAFVDDWRRRWQQQQQQQRRRRAEEQREQWAGGYGSSAGAEIGKLDLYVALAA